MSNRFLKTQVILNNSKAYEQFLKSRNLKTLTQYTTFEFSNLSRIESSSIPFLFHTVEPFEKIFVISEKYYKSPEYGWLICYLNKIPNELQISEGDIIKIYYPIEKVLEFL